MTTVLLIATADVVTCSRPLLLRMLQSTLDQGGLGTHVLLLLQRADADSAFCAELELRFPNLTLLRASTRMSLSAARNHALDVVSPNVLESRDVVVGFADDDCWYPPGTLARVVELFSSSSVDFVGVSYSDNGEALATSRFSEVPGEIDYRCAERWTSSITVLYRAAVLGSIGKFDERFGIGTSLGGAEDIDFVVRALRANNHGRYEPGIVLGHPIKDRSPTHYFRGSLGLAVKHALSAFGLYLLPRLAVRAVRMIARGNMRARAFLKDVMIVLAAFATSPRRVS